jgi:hypothetical protein
MNGVRIAPELAAEQGEAGDEHHHRADDEDAVFEEVERQHRLHRARFRQCEDREHHHREEQEPDHLRRAPFVLPARPRQREQQRYDGEDQRRDARPVDDALDATGAEVGEGEAENGEGDDAQGDVDVKHPPP